MESDLIFLDIFRGIIFIFLLYCLYFAIKNLFIEDTQVLKSYFYSLPEAHQEKLINKAKQESLPLYQIVKQEYLQTFSNLTFNKDLNLSPSEKQERKSENLESGALKEFNDSFSKKVIKKEAGKKLLFLSYELKYAVDDYLNLKESTFKRKKLKKLCLSKIKEFATDLESKILKDTLNFDQIKSIKKLLQEIEDLLSKEENKALELSKALYDKFSSLTPLK